MCGLCCVFIHFCWFSFSFGQCGDSMQRNDYCYVMEESQVLKVSLFIYTVYHTHCTLRYTTHTVRYVHVCLQIQYTEKEIERFKRRTKLPPEARSPLPNNLQMREQNTTSHISCSLPSPHISCSLPSPQFFPGDWASSYTAVKPIQVPVTTLGFSTNSETAGVSEDSPAQRGEVTPPDQSNSRSGAGEGETRGERDQKSKSSDSEQ